VRNVAKIFVMPLFRNAATYLKYKKLRIVDDRTISWSKVI